MTPADRERVREWLEEDASAPARGLVNGCLLSAVLWAVIGVVILLLVGCDVPAQRRDYCRQHPTLCPKEHAAESLARIADALEQQAANRVLFDGRLYYAKCVTLHGVASMTCRFDALEEEPKP